MSFLKNRQLKITTDNPKDVKHLLSKSRYKNRIEDRNLIVEIKKGDGTAVKLIGYDNNVKATYNKLDRDVLNNIFDRIDAMPMRPLDSSIRRQNKMLSDKQTGGEKGLLYSDDRPKLTVKGLGYKDAKIAQDSIKKISKRSIEYQKATIRTLYYRALHHKNKTDDMKRAIKVFKKWLDKNNDKKRKYKYLSLSTIKKYEKLAEEYNVSKVARGKEKASKSDLGFLEAYKKYKTAKQLSFTPARLSKPESNDYDSLREKFINSRLGQIKKANTPLYKKDGTPTKQHVILIMHAYSPDKKLYK